MSGLSKPRRLLTLASPFCHRSQLAREARSPELGHSPFSKLPRPSDHVRRTEHLRESGRPVRRDEDLLTHRSGIAYAFFSEGPLQAAYEQVLGDPALNPMSADQWLAGLGTLPLAY